MNRYLKIYGIHTCLHLRKKQCDKDITKEFIKQIKIDYFDVFRNPSIESNIKSEKIAYKLSAENGFFTVFDETPFHAHFGLNLKNEKELENFDKTIANIGKLCDKIIGKEIEKINFVMTVNFSLNKEINISGLFNNEKIVQIKKKDIKDMQFSGVDFSFKDEDNKGYQIKISNDEEKVLVSIFGVFVPEKREDVVKINEIYAFVKQKIEKVLKHIEMLE